MADTVGMVPRRVLEFFYLLTPLFAAVDLVFGVPARAAGIPDRGWRLAYYGLLMGCWLACRYKPGSAPLVGLVESGVNLLLLFLAVLLPIWNAGEHMLANGGDAALYGPGIWWNLAISGPMLILSIKLNEKAIINRWPPTQRNARPTRF
ncbi:MAG: hypothetical protein ACR2QM_03550 [Longimicrobiales bacterium]